MNDLIHGFATDIIDAKTFRIDLTWESPKNKFLYNRQETVFIDAAHVIELSGYSTHEDGEVLKGKLRGRIIKCNVRNRDSNGKLVCAILGVY